MESNNLDKIIAESFVDGAMMRNYINYKGLIVPKSYEAMADSIENFEVRDDDIWVCSFPKTGTTWTQEMVWTIVNDVDSESGKIVPDIRFPFLEYSMTQTAVCSSAKESEGTKTPDYIKNSIEYVANRPSPRYIETHLPFHLLPRQLRSGEKKCKIIYVTRNPKDAVVSCYHFNKMLKGYHGTFENYCKLFLGDKVIYAPFWDHVIGYWEMREKKNILFSTFENMKTDLPSVIRRTADFLGKKLCDDQVSLLENHLSFSQMKKNRFANKENVIEYVNKTRQDGIEISSEGGYLRKGTVGQWKDAMTEELIKQFDNWTAAKLRNFPQLRDEFKDCL